MIAAKNNKMEEFNKEEVEALKELAKNHLFFMSLHEGETYRNRFETWDDTYNNLRAMGSSHEQVIKRIGEKKK